MFENNLEELKRHHKQIKDMTLDLRLREAYNLYVLSNVVDWVTFIVVLFLINTIFLDIYPDKFRVISKTIFVGVILFVLFCVSLIHNKNVYKEKIDKINNLM